MKASQPTPCEVPDCPHQAIGRSIICKRHQVKALVYKLSPVRLIDLLSVGECENPGCRRVAEHVDHDHETGEVRGYLCFGCNVALGHVDDELDRLIGLIAYLEDPPAPRRLAHLPDRKSALIRPNLDRSPESMKAFENPDDPRHGTLTAYRNLACRCAKCLGAQRAYAKALRERNSAASAR